MSETKKILQRCEIAQADKWAIEDLYATDEAWSADLEKLKVMTQQLAAYAGHLADSPAKLLAYLEQTEAVGVLSEDLANYCMRKADEDTRDSKYQAMQGQYMSAAVALSAAVSFETPEIPSWSATDGTCGTFAAGRSTYSPLGRRSSWLLREKWPTHRKISIASLPMQTSPSPMRRTARATGIP